MKYLNRDINAQSGRSMVEMLGVLAIIGVLSIGGIAGYSYGMDKYRANETINDVNLRAMDLISQLSQGTTPTLSSWDETGTVGYSIFLHTDESTTNYYIKVEKVPFRVCDIISDTMPESVVIEINNDTEQCAEGENTMYFSYEGFNDNNNKTQEENTKQCGTTICGECQICDTTTTTCVTVGDYEDKCTTDEEKSGWCVSGICEPENCNCGPNQYCADTNESGTVPHPGTECKTATYTPYTITYTDESGKTKTETWYAIEEEELSWWDAKSACQAIGKELPYSPLEFVLTYTPGTAVSGIIPHNNRWKALKEKQAIRGIGLWLGMTAIQWGNDRKYIISDTEQGIWVVQFPLYSALCR